MSGFGLIGCATQLSKGQQVSELLPAFYMGNVIRIEVPVTGETLLNSTSVGSGFLLSDSIGVSCAHVFWNQVGNEPIRSQIANKEYTLHIIGMNNELDIAVFRIDPPATKILNPVSPVEQSDLGQKVYIWGFPLPGVILDTSPSVTAGIISGIGKTIRCEDEVIEGLIQVDAVSSSGNSGSPVLMSNGQIIGMVIFAATGSQAEWRGATFAMPIAEVEEEAYRLLKQNDQGISGDVKKSSELFSVKNLLNIQGL